jgi:hypothetical protein
MKTKTFCAVHGLCLIAFLYTASLKGQSALSGTVLDFTQKPLPGATVLLLSATDSTLVQGRLSDNEGGYRLENIAAGTYLLRVTMIGLEEHFSAPFFMENADKTLTSITLQEKNTDMAEVQIVAKKPLFEQKIDRLAINVAGSGINAGGNALQVLQRSPGVLVNKQSNTISMSGKSGVIIMINGKISRMPPDAVLQMLEGTSADNIERIELIHTPPASFDAEGSAGIINIVLKQSADAGLNGNYSLNGGYGRREKYGAALNFNYRKQKVNVFGSYSYQFDHNPQVFTNYRGIYQDNNFLETDGNSDRSPDLGTQNARVGADFQVSPKTVVGVVGTYFDRYWDMDAVNNIDYRLNGTTDYRVQMLTKEINRWFSTTGNVNLTHEFNKNSKLTLDGDYVYYKIHNPSDYDIQTLNADGTARSADKLRVRKETPIQIYVAKADYTHQLGKETQLEAGIKGTRSFFDNDVRVENLLPEGWMPDAQLTSYFKLKEDVGAAYASISFKANAKTDVKFGLRYEYTNTNLGSVEQPNVVDRQYGNLFPSIYLSRKISENQQLNLSYSRRIYRPGFTQLAPYLIFYDPTTVQGGNPALQPCFVHAIRSDYRYKVVGITAEYNYESPSIRDVPVVDVLNNAQVTRPENIGSTHTAYVMINVPWQPVKWWSMQGSAFLAWQGIQASYAGSNLDISSKFMGLNGSNTFVLPHKFSIELTGNMLTGANFGLYYYKFNGQLNVGIQKELGGNRGKINLNVTDIFMSNNWFGSVNRPELNLLVGNSFQQAERTFMLTWSNKFGNNKLRDARQRSRGAEDEMRRL